MKTKKSCFVVASCKPWHKPLFDEICCDISGEWKYASNLDELEKALVDCCPRYIFFLHWSWAVPEETWMKYECVCFHMTDVPYGRGGSPLQNLIQLGHKQTVLTALRMVREIDAGPVYAKLPLALHGSAEEIYIRAGKLSFDIIRILINRNLQPEPQSGDAVLFKRRKPEQSGLPGWGDLRSAYDFIRMLDADGYPHAFIDHGDYRISFRRAKLETNRLVAEVEIVMQAPTLVEK